MVFARESVRAARENAAAPRMTTTPRALVTVALAALASALLPSGANAQTTMLDTIGNLNRWSIGCGSGSQTFSTAGGSTNRLGVVFRNLP
jgi:hypothetical protein